MFLNKKLWKQFNAGKKSINMPPKVFLRRRCFLTTELLNSKIGLGFLVFLNRRFPFLRIMAFEIGGPVGEQRVGDGVGFIERIGAILLDIVKHGVVGCLIQLNWKCSRTILSTPVGSFGAMEGCMIKTEVRRV